MIRTKGLHYNPEGVKRLLDAINRVPINPIPKALPFSAFPEAVIKNLETDCKDEFLMELTILNMLSEMADNRDRVILLLLILRGDGYNFDHESCAKVLKINIRWYFRLIDAIQRRLARYNVR